MGLDVRREAFDYDPDFCAVLKQFTGKERDAESGLDWFAGPPNASNDPDSNDGQQVASIFTTGRYYGSALGRFTSADIPLWDQDPTDPQSWNLYGYVRNNPLVNIDPSGRSCVTLDNGSKSDDGDGKGCTDAGVKPGNANDPSTLNQGQTNAQATAKNPSDLEYAWTISTNEIPRYDPNDVPLPDNARRIFTLAYQQASHDLGCVGLGWAVQGGAIAASAEVIPKGFSAGAKSGTSIASKVLGGGSLGIRVPTPVGTPGTSSFAWRASTNLGRIGGRYLPYIGTAASWAVINSCLSSHP